MLFEKMTEVLDPEPHGAALNMAIDEVLLRSARAPLLRIYRWAKPAISLGYFEKIADATALPVGWEMVRRWTGGGVVEHGEDITYTLVVPADHPLARSPAPESYCEIHRCVAAALQASGLETSLAPASAPKVSTSCFENPAAADVLASGRKIAGAAQRRTRWGLLHQGSIQGAGFDSAIVRRLGPSFAAEIDQRPILAAEIEDARVLAAGKYASDAWMRRF